VPYLGGESPNAVDVALAPRLYHVEVAMREFQVCRGPLIFCPMLIWVPWLPCLTYMPSDMMGFNIDVTMHLSGAELGDPRRVGNSERVQSENQEP
jgi:hypothetical protein